METAEFTYCSGLAEPPSAGPAPEPKSGRSLDARLSGYSRSVLTSTPGGVTSKNPRK